jgi:hypothetical protein
VLSGSACRSALWAASSGSSLAAKFGWLDAGPVHRIPPFAAVRLSKGLSKGACRTVAAAVGLSHSVSAWSPSLLHPKRLGALSFPHGDCAPRTGARGAPGGALSCLQLLASRGDQQVKSTPLARPRRPRGLLRNEEGPDRKPGELRSPTGPRVSSSGGRRKVCSRRRRPRDTPTVDALLDNVERSLTLVDEQDATRQRGAQGFVGVSRPECSSG